jgi:phospholipid transport system substrate-binding protein
MPTHAARRMLLGLTAAALLALTAAPRAAAQAPGASAFVDGFARDLTGIVNGPQSAAQKKAALGPVIDSHVDVAKIARFCLGRFWSTATPAQQEQYTTIFHQVLLNNIRGHLGEYQGVTYTMRGETPQGANTLVGTVINRPNAPSANVQWVVESVGGAPKVVDVVAEGTSLRLTQRSDYASYLSRHGNDISALLAALQNQLNAN